MLADGATAKFSVDQPDEAVGILALMRAIGTTDLDFYDGLLGHLANASKVTTVSMRELLSSFAGRPRPPLSLG